MRRKRQAAAVVELSPREVHILVTALRAMITLAESRGLPIITHNAETRALARRLARTYATLAD